MTEHQLLPTAEECIKKGLLDGLGVNDFLAFKKENPILYATIVSIVSICYQTGDWDGKKSDLCLCEISSTHPLAPKFSLAHCYEYIDGTFEWYDSRDEEIQKPAKWRLVEEDTPQVSKKDIEKILFETNKREMETPFPSFFV